MVATLLVLAWIALAGRLVHLQWMGRANFQARAQRQRTFTETIVGRPGDIVDRNGRLLATTVSTRSLFVVPVAIDDVATFSNQLGDALGVDASNLQEHIDAHRDKQFLWVKRRLSEAEVEAVRNLKLEKDTFGFRDEYLRSFPQGDLASHILGLRDIDGVGRGGLEEKLDPLLHGQDGKRIVVRDARGRVIEVHDDPHNVPHNGRTVVLALDTVIQLFAERELDKLMTQWKPKSCCVIVLDPKTSDVLAMASRPSFDPNRPENVAPDAWKNTAISSIYEPGSTFKPFIVAWALQKGLIERDEVFDCEHGAYRMGKRVLHDHHHYGELDVTDILVKSSNIGMAKIGERLTNRGLYAATVSFGFGRRTGSELPGELDGIVRPYKEWNDYSTGSIPMGQELAVTPLQLINAHAALANGGRLSNPRLVLRHVASPDALDAAMTEEVEPASVVSQTVDAETAKWIIEGPMVEVVKRGTGKKAKLSDFIVFGKTGTAQKLDALTGLYSTTRHVASFLCGAPAHDPRALVLVVVDEPTTGSDDFGGTVAAAPAAKILHKTLVHLHVPADMPLRAAQAE